MYSWLNVGSLLLSLTALVIPVIIIVRYKKTGNRNQPVLYGASMCACALSLFFQICYSDHLVKIKDWSALSYLGGGSVRGSESSSGDDII